MCGEPETHGPGCRAMDTVSDPNVVRHVVQEWQKGSMGADAAERLRSAFLVCPREVSGSAAFAGKPAQLDDEDRVNVSRNALLDRLAQRPERKIPVSGGRPMTMGEIVESEGGLPVPAPRDPWAHRSEGMRCSTCMWYVPKDRAPLGRCRRHAPTISGFPVVFAEDWCGDHRLNEEAVR